MTLDFSCGSVVSLIGWREKVILEPEVKEMDRADVDLWQ